MDTIEFGKFIAQRRKEVALSQKDIADFLNVSIPTISKWENGERIPDLSLIGNLAKLLQVDIESFINFKSEKNNSFDDENNFDIYAFAKYFSYLRKINNYSLVSLAEVLNIRYQTISKWENAESTPNIFILKKCADLFKVPLSEIYYGKKLSLALNEANNDNVVIETKKKKKNIFPILLSIFSIIVLIFSVCLSLFDNKSNYDSSSELIISENISTSNEFDNKVIVTYTFSSLLDPVSFVIEKGSKVTKYIPPVDGYNFYYYLDGEEFDFNTKIYISLTIECELVIKKYTVNFYDEDNIIINTQEIEHGKDAIAPSISSKNETLEFLKWDKDFSNITSDLDIYPIFIYKSVDITFNPNGGICSILYIDDYDSNMFDTLPVPEKEGYIFIGWYNEEKLFTKDNEVTNPIVLTAKYIPGEFIITLSPNGGNNVPKTINAIYDSEITLPTPIKENNTFIGWYYKDNIVPNIFIYKYDYNITLEAKYSEVSGLYTYVDKGETIDLIGYLGNEADIILPSIINDKKVTSISKNIFDDKKNIIKSITIPSSYNSFTKGLLKNLTKLEKLYLTDDINISLMNLFDNSIPDSFTTIEFFGVGDFIFPNLLDYNLTKPFNVIIGHNFTSVRVIENKDFFKELIVNCDADFVLYQSNNVESITLNGKQTKVQNFSSNLKLEKIILPNTIKSIEYRAFHRCSALKNIIIPDSVETIGEEAFITCPEMTYIVIPSSLKVFPNGVFSGCIGLEKVYYKGTLEEWKNIMFEDEEANPLHNGAKLYINNEEVIDPSIFPSK